MRSFLRSFWSLTYGLISISISDELKSGSAGSSDSSSIEVNPLECGTSMIFRFLLVEVIPPDIFFKVFMRLLETSIEVFKRNEFYFYKVL